MSEHTHMSLRCKHFPFLFEVVKADLCTVFNHSVQVSFLLYETIHFKVYLRFS